VRVRAAFLSWLLSLSIVVSNADGVLAFPVPPLLKPASDTLFCEAALTPALSQFLDALYRRAKIDVITSVRTLFTARQVTSPVNGRDAAGLSPLDFRDIPSELFWHPVNQELDIDLLEEILARMSTKLSAQLRWPLQIAIVGGTKYLQTARERGLDLLLWAPELPPAFRQTIPYDFTDAITEELRAFGDGLTFAVDPMGRRLHEGVIEAQFAIRGHDSVYRLPVTVHIRTVMDRTELLPEFDVAEHYSASERWTVVKQLKRLLESAFYFGLDARLYEGLRQLFLRREQDLEDFDPNERALMRLAAEAIRRSIHRDDAGARSKAVDRLLGPVFAKRPRDFGPRRLPPDQESEWAAAISRALALLEETEFKTSSVMKVLGTLADRGHIQPAAHLPGSLRAQRTTDGTLRILVREDLLFLWVGPYSRDRRLEERLALDALLAVKLVHEAAEVMMETAPGVKWSRGDLDPMLPNSEAAAYVMEVRAWKSLCRHLPALAGTLRRSTALSRFYHQTVLSESGVLLPQLLQHVRGLLFSLGYPSNIDVPAVESLLKYIESHPGTVESVRRGTKKVHNGFGRNADGVSRLFTPSFPSGPVPGDLDRHSALGKSPLRSGRNSRAYRQAA
jgi:hypothetical protein